MAHGCRLLVQWPPAKEPAQAAVIETLLTLWVSF
jgi:hypothetical protein